MAKEAKPIEQKNEQRAVEQKPVTAPGGPPVGDTVWLVRSRGEPVTATILAVYAPDLVDLEYYVASDRHVITRCPRQAQADGWIEGK